MMQMFEHKLRLICFSISVLLLAACSLRHSARSSHREREQYIQHSDQEKYLGQSQTIETEIYEELEIGPRLIDSLVWEQGTPLVSRAHRSTDSLHRSVVPQRVARWLKVRLCHDLDSLVEGQNSIQKRSRGVGRREQRTSTCTTTLLALVAGCAGICWLVVRRYRSGSAILLLIITIPLFSFQMRPDQIRYIVVHCSATPIYMDYPSEVLVADHIRRGFSEAGYHFYVRKCGLIIPLRPLSKMGAHTRGYNRCSIGVCYEGGLDSLGKPADTRTPEQRQALSDLLSWLHARYPIAYILGHRDLSPDLNGNGVVEPWEWRKACPCLDVAREYGWLNRGRRCR